MILALKVGGYAIFSTRYDYIDEKCQPTMDKLVEEGKWELVERSNWIRYPEIGEGLGRFVQTPCMTATYKKL